MMPALSYPGTSGATTTIRPMTEPERKAAIDSVKPMRNNARGMAALSILMAVMINFVNDPIAMLMPLFFGSVAIGLAVQARKSVKNVSKVLTNGTVTEIRTVPRKASARKGWEFGIYGAASSRALDAMLPDGVPASFTIVPETRHLLAVNGMPLRRPLLLTAPPGYMNTLPAAAAPQIPAATIRQVDEELPPPPDDWTERPCTNCGHNNPVNATFCEKCGTRITM